LDYHEGVGNAIDAGTIANGAVICIWIIREVDQAAFPELNTDLTGKELAAILEAAQAAMDEAVNLSITWD
jgi:hypothetical protein